MLSADLKRHNLLSCGLTYLGGAAAAAARDPESGKCVNERRNKLTTDGIATVRRRAR